MSSFLQFFASGVSVPAVITSVIALPYKYDAATDDVAYTISGTCPSDTAIEIYDGAAKLGDATVTAGAFTFTYTWTAVDASVQLKAVGNVSGDSAVVPMSVSQVNKINKVISSWSKLGNTGNWTMTGGHSDPLGGTAAYRMLFTANSSGAQERVWSPSFTWTPDDINSGIAIWVGTPVAGSGIKTASVWPYNGGENHIGYLRLGTPYIFCNDMFVCRTKTLTRDGINWAKYVIQLQLDGDGDTESAYTSVLLEALSNATGASASTFTAGDSVYYMIDTTISTQTPWLERDRISMQSASISANGVELFYFRHPYRTTLADYLGNPSTLYCDLRVLKPDSWAEGVEYTVVWLPSPVFYTTYVTDSGFDIMEQIAIADYHNTYNCVFIMCDISRNGMDYWNDYSDGVSKLHERLFTDVLMPKAQEFWGCSSDPERNLMIGWSKTGCAAVSFIFRRSEVGYILADDLPYNMAYGDYFSSTSYGTEANWLTYNAKTIIGSARADIKTTNRIMLVGGYSFPTDMSDFASALTSNGIQFTNLNYTEAAHSWENAFNNIPAFMTFAGVA